MPMAQAAATPGGTDGGGPCTTLAGPEGTNSPSHVKPSRAKSSFVTSEPLLMGELLPYSLQIERRMYQEVYARGQGLAEATNTPLRLY